LNHDNILWTLWRNKEKSLTSSISFRYIKSTNFGISKIEVGSESFELYNMSSSIYRALEVLKIHGEGNAIFFQADVYSFGITSAKNLCRKLSFEQPYNFSRELYEKIKVRIHLVLSSFCRELSTLIKEYCAFNPYKRPTFSKI